MPPGPSVIQRSVLYLQQQFRNEPPQSVISLVLVQVTSAVDSAAAPERATAHDHPEDLDRIEAIQARLEKDPALLDSGANQWVPFASLMTMFR
jgi:hypothetical protein